MHEYIGNPLKPHPIKRKIVLILLLIPLGLGVYRWLNKPKQLIIAQAIGSVKLDSWQRKSTVEMKGKWFPTQTDTSFAFSVGTTDSMWIGFVASKATYETCEYKPMPIFRYKEKPKVRWFVY